MLGVEKNCVFLGSGWSFFVNVFQEVAFIEKMIKPMEWCNCNFLYK